MKPSYLMTALLVASTLACCGGTPKVTRHDDESVRPPDAAPTPRGNEAATGELRDALILLHRIHFGYDSAVILADARTALTEAAGPLRAHPEVHLYVDGHTDERGPSSYNLDLGERRARAVVEALARLGVERDRLHVTTFGEASPLASGHTPVALATNRRADFRLYRGDVRLDLEDGVLYDDRGQPLSGAALRATSAAGHAGGRR